MALRYYTMKPYESLCVMLELTKIQQKKKKTSKVPEYLLVVQLWKIININVSEMTTNFTLKKLNKGETKEFNAFAYFIQRRQ